MTIYSSERVEKSKLESGAFEKAVNLIKNRNQYTKSELISKLKEQQSELKRIEDEYGSDLSLLASSNSFSLQYEKLTSEMKKRKFKELDEYIERLISE
ncbi:hypothetical protein [uncultured Metabacillus sp.]|uniref:hypothetical protein n=1 Tax=uncultured Metabacillus sp. TaxID=2860135 RepID=UPI00261D50D1|nr:hypothetical protein [uncultured Metabacillus sp.]